MIASRRGLTLIEIMIVVSIIAMVAAGVAVVAIPKMKEAQIQSAETGARVIRNAVSQWQLSENEYGECPSVSQLVEDKQLDAGQTTVDPWGQDYQVTCADDEVVVSSSGPDKKKGSKEKKAEERTGSLGFEAKLWEAADFLRNNMDPAEYKHVVLGLIFLKYIEDAFEARRDTLRAAVADPDSEYFVENGPEREQELEAILEERDEFVAENVFWVPKKARWTEIQAQAKQPDIGKVIDDAMDEIEKENRRLKGLVADLSLDKQILQDVLSKKL